MLRPDPQLTNLFACILAVVAARHRIQVTQYHVVMAWEDAPWTLPELAAVIAEFEQVSVSATMGRPFGEKALAMLDALLAFLRESAR